MCMWLKLDFFDYTKPLTTLTPFTVLKAKPRSLQHLQTLHRLLVLLGVNGPLLAARLFLWQHLHLPISTFAIKNVGVPFLMLYSIYDYAHHQRLQAGLHEVQEMIS